jgi:hypothetical protein
VLYLCRALSLSGFICVGALPVSRGGNTMTAVALARAIGGPVSRTVLGRRIDRWRVAVTTRLAATLRHGFPFTASCWPATEQRRLE